MGTQRSQLTHTVPVCSNPHAKLASCSKSATWNSLAVCVCACVFSDFSTWHTVCVCVCVCVCSELFTGNCVCVRVCACVLGLSANNSDSKLQVLLHAGPKGLKVAQILDAVCSLGLVAEGWADNRASRASQISNAMRNTPLFVHVGDHKYAIAAFPGVHLVPLKSAPGNAGPCYLSLILFGPRPHPGHGPVTADSQCACWSLAPIVPYMGTRESDRE